MNKQKIDRDEAANHLHDHRPQDFINDYAEWHWFNLPLESFMRLLLNSVPNDPADIKPEEFPTMTEVYDIIQADPERFFAFKHPNGGLNGAQVKKYLNDFHAGVDLRDCFIIDLYPDMNPAGSYYIRDGMHRLVAYALYSQLRPEFFPVRIYLSGRPLRK